MIFRDLASRIFIRGQQTSFFTVTLSILRTVQRKSKKHATPRKSSALLLALDNLPRERPPKSPCRIDLCRARDFAAAPPRQATSGPFPGRFRPYRPAPCFLRTVGALVFSPLTRLSMPTSSWLHFLIDQDLLLHRFWPPGLSFDSDPRTTSESLREDGLQLPIPTILSFSPETSVDTHLQIERAAFQPGLRSVGGFTTMTFFLDTFTFSRLSPPGMASFTTVWIPAPQDACETRPEARLSVIPSPTRVVSLPQRTSFVPSKSWFLPSCSGINSLFHTISCCF